MIRANPAAGHPEDLPIWGLGMRLALSTWYLDAGEVIETEHEIVVVEAVTPEKDGR